MNAGVAYTIASGRLFCFMPDLHVEAERLLDRPVWTHEFASHDVWDALRAATEEELMRAVEAGAEDPATPQKGVGPSDASL